MNKIIHFSFFVFLLAISVCVLAQSKPYPNELKGYGFFRTGKLKGLKIGVSTKVDVKRTFGENCEDFCDYNSDWAAIFHYLDASECFTREATGEPKREFCPEKNFVGKLSSVTLRPKKIISFAKISSSNFNGYGVGSSISEDGKGNGVHTSTRIFSDVYGLNYEVFDKVVSSTRKTSSKIKKGDLVSIQYEFSKELEKKIFIEQK